MATKQERNFRNRHTLPKDEHIGRIFKVTMLINDIDTIIGIGSHLLTDEVNLEVTIRLFSGNIRTFGMGHTKSGLASVDEIKKALK